ncbi:uncharacterized protein METZ01_LOCUS438033 [marine metagenome]|uniref:Uncharacterized protein n=1 Tax=marine metagenome TaxID=408172 RepID=A0A382YQC4_9ZZZZ
MKIARVEGHAHLVRDLKTQAIVNTDSDAYARYMARKVKQAEKEDELRCVVREINTLKAEMFEIKSLIKEIADRNGR